MARLLIVDDDPGVRSVLSAGLRRAGNDVSWACDGLEALEGMRAQRPDVVLTDVSMPWLDGWELLQACRADASMQSIPIIMMSASRGLGELANARGAAGFLAKPFAWQEAHRAIERALEVLDSQFGSNA
jgi:chemosensory pili system protein ChpA (sensor histidine kinase/response regulator)